MDYLVTSISSIKPKRPDMDRLFQVWDAKYRPADDVIERSARLHGISREEEVERRFQIFATRQIMSGFC